MANGLKRGLRANGLRANGLVVRVKRLANGLKRAANGLMATGAAQWLVRHLF